MTSNQNRADALTEELYILSVNEEAMEEAISRFEGSSTGEALKCVLHSQKKLRALLVASPVEQPSAAPIEAIANLLNDGMNRAVANGADSRSMPDDYVAIAHFVCYPHEYGCVTEPAETRMALTDEASAAIYKAAANTILTMECKTFESWSAALVRAILGAPADHECAELAEEKAEIPKAIDALIYAAWYSGEQDGVDSVKWQDKGDSYNQSLRSNIEEKKSNLLELLKGKK